MYKKILGGLALSVGMAMQAQAALPNITVSYIQPTGVVSPTDSIEMWIRISSDRQIGVSAGPTFGFDAADLPATGEGYVSFPDELLTNEPFASYTGLIIGYGSTCLCDNLDGYDFVDPPFSNPRAAYRITGTDLPTGDFLVGTFVPNGAIALGNHALLMVPSLTITVVGKSAGGVTLSQNLGPAGAPDYTSYATCSFDTWDTCGFSRTVVAVPEPGILSSSLFGLAVAAGLTRRRLRTKA